MQSQIDKTPCERICACQREIEAEARQRKRPVIKTGRIQPGVKLGDKRAQQVSFLRPIRQGREHRVIVAQQCTGESRHVHQRTGDEGRQHENGAAPSQVSHSARFRDQLPAIDLGAGSDRVDHDGADVGGAACERLRRKLNRKTGVHRIRISREVQRQRLIARA